MRLEYRDGLYFLPHGKAVLALTKAEFIRALQRGKYYRRLQATEARHTKAQDKGMTETLHRPEIGA
jgi:hypothetical protein